ncbi:chloride channel protein [Adhaeribacter aerolatus]|uniref:Chloride channel protein n=1 Tax=Adhaeribacter aerolatus TaxID=670289 RepID=A0A512AZ79_9BACT|nr:chloride channel protein [Adhaeribacter aerolatus]GEO05022.1 chloride channel protein [Adhaeribacter aerolatus]
MENNIPDKGIPIAVSLTSTLEAENMRPQIAPDKKRLLIMAALAVVIAICISFISKLLVYLIDLVTHISFYGNLSVEPVSPAHHQLGLFVIVVPAIGGVIIGLMALYGSKAIRGHGIPEAMEQVLTNQSRIKPSITYLKPISSAISIGTGGPFGAEGPIIATGGALGSTLGQLLNITHIERKILLAAGATAGMSAIFGSPVAAIFLAIELLLFEFSPRSIIPVALACITGAAGHHFLFEGGPVFPIDTLIGIPSNPALVGYSAIGIVVGLLSVVVTKLVYLVEDAFEKLPVHWMWWPAIGGLGVGVVGYFAPRTLGVGYENITDILSGNIPVQLVLSLGLLKFVSWVIALGSGTSGGTLAPLLTIGAAAGALLGSIIIFLFPEAGVTLILAALVGMSAMFAGASRALITSIIFAIETTSQSNALLPLLASCTGSYFVSFFLMENTIMTEKIARRGVKTPHSYEPDILEKVTIGQVIQENRLALGAENRIGEVREWLEKEQEYNSNFFVIVNPDQTFKGIISSSNLYSSHHHSETLIGSLIKRLPVSVSANSSLRMAVEIMAKENVDVLPVVSRENTIMGVLTYKDIIGAYKKSLDEHEKQVANLSLKNYSLKILQHGQKLITTVKKGSK